MKEDQEHIVITNNDMSFSLGSSQKYSRKSGGSLMSFLSIKLYLLKHFRKFGRRWSKYSSKQKLFVLCLLIAAECLFLELHFGIIEKCFFEVSFKTEFEYAAKLDDFDGTVSSYMNSANRHDFQPEPINLRYSSIPFIGKSVNWETRFASVGLLIIVKSATRNYKKRKSIRTTWGDLKLTPKTKLVFICGIPTDWNYEKEETELSQEKLEHGDIVLADYLDTYENNTYKTMLAMKWAIEEVKSFEYLLIADDDMYVSVENLIKFTNNIPYTLATVMKSEETGVVALNISTFNENVKVSKSPEIISLKGQPLLLGNLFMDASPMRNYIGSGSKWSLSIKEYPYDSFPPYLGGGAQLLDRATVSRIYYASLFTKHFWIDDVYVGIIAHKLGIKMTHTDLIDSSHKEKLASRFKDKFQEMIAIHGLECPEQLVELWRTRDFESLPDC